MTDKEKMDREFQKGFWVGGGSAIVTYFLIDLALRVLFGS
jgi:hypothetical protein